MRRLLIFLVFFTGGLAHAETVAVIGTGNVGMALGTEFADLGHTVIYGSRNPQAPKTVELVAMTGNGASAALPAEAAADADVVILAVPGMVTETVARGLGDLEGKIIIDATNPLTQSDDASRLEYGVATSNGQIVQAMHAGAFVVKAFNTIPWQRMIDPGDPPAIVPLAGNDADAKSQVGDWVHAMGLETVDIGDIENARVTEQMIVLTLNSQFSDGPKYTIEFRKLD